MATNLNASSLLHKRFLHSPPLHPLRFRRANIAPLAKFNVSELLGGRGLCNGEEGVQKEISKPKTKPASVDPESELKSEESGSLGVDPDGFEKEMMGFTGGFPGGEKGLKLFIEKNPPPPKDKGDETLDIVLSKKKPSVPDLPLFLPGMIAIVKNPRNPFYMYCGIVQRVTDGKVGVLFEGGNWDKLITFELDELERRDKGPPMVNPKSAIIETMVEKSA
ncbi:Chlororespiratory reduction31 [Rhynchospora pubera]|uniref:Chlororespiratory reduction31 n=1 Tax=Rhynchospora pubera TaxID=906938 RepID=A0AAV8GVF7_9POAL|nr:Chlororespiratory reduction31 [Rhynchospora pubera]